MSMHKTPLTEIERTGLEKHHLPVGSPSQLSDCFRLGVKHAAEANTQAVPDVDALTDKIAAMLSGTYHCTRVWNAWNVGTMSEDDFCPVDDSDTPREIAEEVLSLLAASPQPAPQPVQTGKLCEPCRSTGLVHCANPDECGGPWTEPTTQPVHPDDLAVDKFAAAMKAKLAKAREKGLEGWEECSAEFLSRMLREHVEKGDPRDVANFCTFLWSLGYGIVAQAPQPERVPLTDEQKHKLALGRFSESWHVRLAIALIEDVEAAHGITKKGG